jgi:hypothetical protein
MGMTVGELFEGDKVRIEMLEERAEESEYLNACYSFIENNWDQDCGRLSAKQISWMHKILENMVEWRIKNQ